MVLLPLQYAAVGFFSLKKKEPWPAFILPAFKSVFSSGDHIALNQAHFFVENNENRARTEISASHLFQGIQKSQLQGFLKQHFADSSKLLGFSDEAKQWLKNQIHQRYPTLKADTLHIEWGQKIFIHPGSAFMRDSVIISKQFNIGLTGV